VRVAANVGHITPSPRVGAHYDLDNMQSLRSEHHKVETARYAARRHARTAT
jgi:hypothetical protein